jgi:DNA-directed RNA polymerase specialized sigma24 family protein
LLNSWTEFIRERSNVSEYQRPMLVDPTRYEQSDAILKAMSTHDEYFAEEKPEDPLVLIVEALLATLPEDERTVLEMCVMAGISMHEAARTLGYINSSGKEDHKMVKRRIVRALRKLEDTLNSPGFATAIAGHKMPVEQPTATVKEQLSNIIKGLEAKAEDDE